MCEKQGAQTAKCNQLKQNVPWNCSVSRFCRCVGRWQSICSSQFWKKQSSHRTDLLSGCWQLWKRSDLAKNSITLKFCQVLFKSRDNIQPNGHFLRQLLNMHERLPVECPWVQTHWDQGKKEEKIMAGIWHNIDWCCVRLPFSALMTGQDEVYSTLIGDKKQTFLEHGEKSLRGELSHWLYKRREASLSFSSERAAGTKSIALGEVPVTWFPTKSALNKLWETLI